MTTPWSITEWRRVVVYGLGLSGKAAMRLLRAKDISVVAVDQRGEAAVARDSNDAAEWILGRSDPELPRAVDAVILSPGVPGDRLLVRQARDAGIPVLSEVELAFPFLAGPVVAVTGSNGKSSTAAMTACILKRAGRAVELCGNIGPPLCSRIDGLAGRIFVVELSSFQLENVSLFKADSAALLNLSPDHLDRYDSFALYAAAKRRIFERQTADSTAVLNADDRGVAEVGDGLAGPRRRYFSRASPVDDGCYASTSAQTTAHVLEAIPGAATAGLFSQADLRVGGIHNLENAMAAALLARSCGVSSKAVRQGLSDFRGLPHRLEKVRLHRGVLWYDDSKGTNIGATEKSLEGFPDHSVHLILGGRGKGADPSALQDAVRRKARRLYFIGEAASQFEGSLARWVESDNVGTLEKAISRASDKAKPGEIVLLSPACSSLDQFENFEDRGRCFQALVNALNGRSGGQEASV